ncbi:cupin-like domain-containing protein [Roseofilum casamattae]|uniref:Cupin-like domain-containing protein n=1 Tax=Roseofilum casamattae BLCC-M143 TaxID=3022442 RepID=A0ABT7BZ57_9CYAN|nr:cupin-like domain-containing protein [Roseofilum casamattae]MDJ1184355.1 cupin-like domain-containing protein [Roseofilum casamattae BLCC-M143]
MPKTITNLFKSIRRREDENKPKSYQPLTIVENISVTEFIYTYEEPKIPVIIRNFELNWPAFAKWDRYFITKALSAEEGNLNFYRRYLRFFPTLDAIEEENNPYSLADGDYLTDITIKDYPALLEDYSIPPFFAEATDQPEKNQWLFIGPPSSKTKVHVDIPGYHAWNVSIYGSKYWWFFPDCDRVLTAIAQPGDIVFTPAGMYHAVVNLEETLSITHNYKR